MTKLEKELSELDNETLLERFENACYRVCHKETKSNEKFLNMCIKEVLRRMEK